MEIFGYTIVPSDELRQGIESMHETYKLLMLIFGIGGFLIGTAFGTILATVSKWIRRKQYETLKKEFEPNTGQL